MNEKKEVKPIEDKCPFCGKSFNEKGDEFTAVLIEHLKGDHDMDYKPLPPGTTLNDILKPKGN